MRSSAIISPDGVFRYLLSRDWEKGDGRVLFVMLNPSTADADRDDPTIRRCIGFAQRFGGQALDVVNLYGFRSTDPNVLTHHHAGWDHVGRDNDDHIAKAAAHAKLIVCAWGARGGMHNRDVAVRRLLERYGRPQCLGLTQGGQPRHPLYVKRTEPLIALSGDPECTSKTP